jgi:hypothetical protein
MLPPWMREVETDQEKGCTPPPLLLITEVAHTASDWVVIYHFFLGPLDGHFTMYLGHLDKLSKEQAETLAHDSKSPLLARAHLALLHAVTLETMQ